MRINVYIICWFFLCGFVFAPLPADAVPYHPAASLLIISEISADLNESGKPDVYTWRVVPKSLGSDGTTRLSFFRENAASLLCRLDLSASGKILDIDIPGLNPNMMIRDEGLIIIPGFPVPCEILPVEDITGKQQADDGLPESCEYHIKRKTSSQTFVNTFVVRSYPIAYEAALANGWINSDLSDVPSTLQVIKVVNQQTNELILLQLWADNADWWIYEKTHYRQSWRLP